MIEPGSTWRHKRTGNLYTVVTVANLEATRVKAYPVTVVYERDGVVWARTLLDWMNGFEQIV